MRKLFSLIKATFSEGLSIVKISTNRMSAKLKKVLPYILFILIIYSFTYYTSLLTKQFHKVGLEYIVILLFAFLTFFLTIMEGIYKTSDLLFNCKDDDLLLALPIKKSTILFIRFFKFYVFELMYNAMFMIPAIISYAIYAKPSYLFYIISVIMLVFLPVIPVLLSVVIGFIIKQFVTRFKYKNIAQIIFTSGLLLGILYISFNSQKFVEKMIANATTLFDLIKKIYYPAYLYYELFTDFNLYKLLIYMGINIILVIIAMNVLSKVYYKINSRSKEVSNVTHYSKYKIKTHKPLISFMIKDLKRVTSSSVYIINACFGLVLFIASAVLLTSRSKTFLNMLSTYGLKISMDQIAKYIPIVLLAMIAFAALTSSTTSSMISLEGKSFSILKSLPISAKKVIYAKVGSALLLMIPAIIIGDIIVYVNYDLKIIDIILTIVASILLPLVSTLLGIFVNTLYPHMDFSNDTEVVKQSMSVMIALFVNFGILIIIGLLIYFGIKSELGISLIILMVNGMALLINIISIILINTIGVKNFNLITI